MDVGTSKEPRVAALANRIEVQKQCIQMEEIKMQHRIHKSKAPTVTEDESAGRHQLSLEVRRNRNRRG